MTKGQVVSYSEPPPPPQYGAPQPPPGAVPPKKSGMAIAALVLGILGVIPCFWGCFVFSLLGVIFGRLGRKDIAESGGQKTGEGFAKAGFILGCVGIALGALYWILVATGAVDITYTSS